MLKKFLVFWFGLVAMSLGTLAPAFGQQNLLPENTAESAALATSSYTAPAGVVRRGNGSMFRSLAECDAAFAVSPTTASAYTPAASAIAVRAGRIPIGYTRKFSDTDIARMVASGQPRILCVIEATGFTGALMGQAFATGGRAPGEWAVGIDAQYIYTNGRWDIDIRCHNLLRAISQAETPTPTPLAAPIVSRVQVPAPEVVARTEQPIRRDERREYDAGTITWVPRYRVVVAEPVVEYVTHQPVFEAPQVRYEATPQPGDCDCEEDEDWAYGTQAVYLRAGERGAPCDGWYYLPYLR